MFRYLLPSLVLAAPLSAMADERTDAYGDLAQCLVEDTGAVGLVYCDRAIQSGYLSDQDLAEALYSRGVKNLAATDADAALSDFTRGISLQPLEGAKYYAARARIYAAAGEKTLADADLAEVERLDPSLLDTASIRRLSANRAAEAWRAGDAEATLAGAQEIVAADPKSIKGWELSALANASLGNEEAALTQYQEAMTLGGKPAVRAYQEKLTTAGFKPGPVDGLYGARTKAALSKCIAAKCGVSSLEY